MSNEEIKQEIKNLVEKYQRVVEAGQIESYNEEMTKQHFILPFFRSLGWDVENINEVRAEEYIKSLGRVDYAFIVEGQVKFYLEAKGLNEDLNREDFAKQAIKYAWNKGIDWAVLTNFKSIKVFNAQAPSKYLIDKLVFEIKMPDYLTDERLEFLARQSFIKNLLIEYAVKAGKMVQKISVGEQLFKDLNESREILTKVLHEQNPKISQDLLDEGVQKILDRLIFIRVVEDRGLEPERSLLAMVHEYQLNKKMGKVTLFQTMVERFRELDKIYDSSLFEPHPCENWEEFSGTAEKIIQRFYGKYGYYEYDFKEIPADVLGTVYENYLGYIAKKPIKAVISSKSGKLFEIEEGKEAKNKSRKKRKEQGIYYTPRFIVDYIVQNTLGKILSEIKSPAEVKNLKILDPACGSGSFLTKAYQALIEFYEKQGVKTNPKTKLGKIGQIIQEKEGIKELLTPERLRILRENIFGVDLDKQAVEIARLNLLLNAVTKRTKLPNLVNNIKWGNSLISGTESELKKYFGENWHDKKPFNWDEEFPFCHSVPSCHSRESGNPGGGFDVIIGNPPYIKEFVNKSAFDGLHGSPYYQGKMDLWTMFACVAIDLLKEGGFLGFIAPNNWITNAGASIFRDKVLKEGELKIFIDFGNYKVFEQAGIQTMIFVFEKKKPGKKYSVDYLRISNLTIEEMDLKSSLYGEKAKIEIEPEKLIGKNISFSTSESGSIFDKIKGKKNFELMEKEVGQGIVAAPDKYFLEKDITPYNKDERSFLKPFYTASGKYKAGESENYIFYICDKNFGDKKIKDYPNIERHFKPFEKILKEAKIKYGTPDKIYFYLHREREEKFFNDGPKIVCGVRVKYPSFYYTEEQYYGSRALNFIKTERINLKYLIGILNSKIVFFWLKNKGKQLGDLLQIDKGPLMEIPICVGDKKQQKIIITLVDKTLSLNKEFGELSKYSDKWQSIKSEIEKTDKLIDQKVYKLYGLNENEIRIIEKE